MKRFVILAAIALTAIAVFSQEFKNRLPMASEERRIAGLSHYPAEDNTALWQNIAGGGITTNLLPSVSYNYIVSSNDISATMLVLPNPTNTQGSVYNVFAPGHATTAYTNAGAGWTIKSSSNYTWNTNGITAKTNTFAKAINLHGTNWIIILTSLATP